MGDRTEKILISDEHCDQLRSIQGKIAISLCSVNDLRVVLETLLEVALEFEPIECGGIYILNSKCNELQLVSHRELSIPFVQHISRFGPNNPQFKIARIGRPVYWSNPSAIFDMEDLIAQEGIRTLAAIPIKVGGKLTAILNVASRTQHDIPHSTRLALETISLLIGIFVDRSRMYEKSCEYEQRFRDFAQNIPVVFWIRTPNGIDYVSPAYEDIWGVSCKTLYENPHSFADHIHPKDKERVLLAYAADPEGKVAFNEDYRIIRPDGEIRWISTQGVIVGTRGGTFRAIGICRDVTEREVGKKNLRKALRQLEEKTRELEEANTALKVLIKKAENDTENFQKTILSNVEDLISPQLERLKTTRLSEEQSACVQIIEARIKEITSPFIRALSREFSGLTPTELQIADFLREGRTTKEIASALNLSEHTIFVHRYRIRTKLGLRNTSRNLRTYLKTMKD